MRSWNNTSKAPTKVTNAPVYFPSFPPSMAGRAVSSRLEKINRTGADNWIEFIEGSKIDAAVLYPPQAFLWA